MVWLGDEPLNTKRVLALQGKGYHSVFAPGAAVFFSLNSCFDRLAVREGTPVFSGFTMTLASAVLLLPFMVLRPHTWQALGAQGRGLWLRGFLEVAFMSAKLHAMRDPEMQPAYVVSIMRLNLLLSIIGGHLFFRERDFARRLLAGSLIVAGAFLVAMAGFTAALFAIIARQGYGYKRDTGFIFEQARYLFPLAALYGATVAVACLGLGRRLAPVLACAFIGLLCLHDLSGILLTLQRYYS